MKTHLYKAALLAALGVAGTTMAHAQAGPALGGGVLGLGFNDAAGPAAAQNDYVINLGSFINFTTTYSASWSISQSAFDSSFISQDTLWANNVAVGVVGGLQGPGGAIFITGSQPTITSASTVNNALSALGGVNTGNYSSSSGIPTDPWSSAVAASPTAPGNAANSVAALIDNPMSNLSNGSATLTLWDASITGTSRNPVLGSWTEVGTFSINANDGADTITFRGINAVPEPATYSLSALGGLLLLALRYRSSRKVA
ncbi:MAG TPA: hypothetical protein VMH87_19410 [Pseudomonadales bacterium]|nr:hypothetical protein [Pseudomonadales bacterium]